jgi:hypothetical protein
MKTYQKYFLVYAFFGVILISVALLAQGIESLADVAKRHSIDAHDVYKLGCWFLVSHCVAVDPPKADGILSPELHLATRRLCVIF